jgi:hypothetical protein
VKITVEDVLRREYDKAALFRYLADMAAANPEAPDSAALSGLADAWEETAETLRAIRHSLSDEALGAELQTPKR